MFQPCLHVCFDVQGMECAFDMVVCMLGTLSHMLDNKQAAAAFTQAAQHLRPGGLLLLELAHPGAAAPHTPQRVSFAAVPACHPAVACTSAWL